MCGPQLIYNRRKNKFKLKKKLKTNNEMQLENKQKAIGINRAGKHTVKKKNKKK